MSARRANSGRCPAATALWRNSNNRVRLNSTAGTNPTDVVVFPALSAEGPGSKFFVDPRYRVDPSLPRTAVVRGGRVTGAEWDIVNRGSDSAAFGLSVVASARQSMALGTAATAADDGALVWADGTTPRESANPDEVTFGASGGFRVYGDKTGASVPAYVGGEIYLDADETVVTGKLTVTGLIDPTGIVFEGQASVPGGVPDASTGTYWATDADPSLPQFSNSAGTTALRVGTTPAGGFSNLAGLTVPNTAAPNYAAANSFVFGSQAMDYTDVGSAVRMFFNKPKAAFRAGADTLGAWDNAAVGVGSTALGLDTTASGADSLAVGSGVQADGANSTALGSGAFSAVQDNTLVVALDAAGSSAAADSVTVIASGGFRALANGTGVPAYIGGEIYLDGLSTVVTGDLAVTGIVLAGSAALGVAGGLSIPGGTPPAGAFTLWSDGNNLMYSNSTPQSRVVAGPFEISGSVVRQNAKIFNFSVESTSLAIGPPTTTGSSPTGSGSYFYKPLGSLFVGKMDGNPLGQGSFVLGNESNLPGVASVGCATTGAAPSGNHTFSWNKYAPTDGEFASPLNLTVLGGNIVQESGFAMVQSTSSSPTVDAGMGYFWTQAVGGGSQPAYKDAFGNNHVLSAAAFVNIGGVTLCDTTAPSYLLSHSFVYGIQSRDGAGTRFMLDKDNGSFCAGSASNIQWDVRGEASVAIGADGVLSGDHCLSLAGSQVTGNNAWGWSDSTVRTAAVSEGIVWGATNGVRVFTDAGAVPGVEVAAGGTSWTTPSDRNMKENVVELTSVLERVEALPIYEYNYRGQDPAVVCRGPMAQDWHALFPSNKDRLRIDTGDLDGVAIAAVRELAALTRGLRARLLPTPV